MIGRGAKRWAALLAGLLLVLAPTLASAHPAWGIVADSQGRVYFSDLETVWRLDPDGHLSVFRPGVEGVHVHELALAADGAVKGDQLSYNPANETYHAGIWRRGADGRESWLLDPSTAPPNGTGLAVDRAGNSYTTQWLSNDDRRTMLWRHRADGRSELLAGPLQAASRYRQIVVASVGGMAFAPDGALLFGDGVFIRRLAPGGAVGDLYRGAPGSNIRGVAPDADGTVYATDFANHRVLAIGGDGKARIIHRSEPGWAPSGLTATGGRLLVLEAEEDPAFISHRVRVIELRDGKARVIASPGAEAARLSASQPAAPPPAQRYGLAITIFLSLALAAGLGLALRAARRRRLAVPD
jgi:hypothetical protein